MKVLLFLTVIIAPFGLLAQSQEDSSEVFSNIGIIELDTNSFQLDYDEVNWQYSDTLVFNLNQKTGIAKFKGGFEYSTSLTLKNFSLKPIKIQSISSPCSCLLSSVPSTAINPISNFDLNLKYKAMEPGDFEDIVTLYGYDATLTRPLVIINVKLIYSVELSNNN